MLHALGHAGPCSSSPPSSPPPPASRVAVIVWAFAGIAAKHSGTPLVAITAWSSAVLVALTLLIGLPHTHGRLRELETSPPSTEARDRW